MRKEQKRKQHKLYRPTIVYALHRFAQSVINAATASSRNQINNKQIKRRPRTRPGGEGDVGKSTHTPTAQVARSKLVQWDASLVWRPFITAFRADEPITTAIDHIMF